MSWFIPPEQIREAFSRVPKPLREFIVEGELARVTQELSQAHKLHVDTAGMLSQLLTMVLLGFMDPGRLPEELGKLGMLSQDIPGFIQELNTKIFIPLQKKVRESGPEPAKEVRAEEEPESTPPAPILKPVPPLAQKPAVVPPSPTLPPLHVEMKSDVSANEKVSEPPETTPSYNLIQPNKTEDSSVVTATPYTPPARSVSAPVPTMRTMQHDMALVQHGEQPIPYMPASAGISAPHPSQMTPAMSFQTASVPFTSTPVPSRPITAPIRHSLPAPKPSIPTPSPIQTENTSDPYREPI